MPHRYFTTEISDGTAVLRGADAHHLSRVMRGKLGDTVILCDGSAVEYTATITGFGDETVEFSVEPGYPSAADDIISVADVKPIVVIFCTVAPIANSSFVAVPDITFLSKSWKTFSTFSATFLVEASAFFPIYSTGFCLDNVATTFPSCTSTLAVLIPFVSTLAIFP